MKIERGLVAASCLHKRVPREMYTWSVARWLQLILRLRKQLVFTFFYHGLAMAVSLLPGLCGGGPRQVQHWQLGLGCARSWLEQRQLLEVL